MPSIVRQLCSPPNLLSLVRLPLAGVVIVRIGHPDAVLWFLFGAFTDYLVGFIARKTHTMTPLGGVLDPLCDKFFVAMIFGYCFVLYGLPSWMLFAFFFRDIFTSIGALIGWDRLKKSGKLKAAFSGKVVTVFQFLILLMLVNNSLTSIESMILTLALASVWSIADYITSFRTLPR
ncbi:MAG: CDP-alcohol phosphatidyltransferase family protein [bacterium]|nr:CDP-alcohol phosphatidyltransferase family protein [bacterium]